MFSLHCGILCIFRLYFLKHFTFIFKCWGFSSFDYVYALRMENNIFILYELSVQFFHYQCFCFFFLFKFYTLYNQNKSLLVKQFVINTGVLFVMLRTFEDISKKWPNLKVCGTSLCMSKPLTLYAVLWIWFLRLKLFAFIYSDEFL